jgi:hypothetical protein
MKIVAFITDHATVARILKHIHMPAQRPEPLAHSPPLQEELSYASCGRCRRPPRRSVAVGAPKRRLTAVATLRACSER